ncbi:MAG: hypothetical protein WA634_03930 [Silvibacterium sp.]
MTLLPRRVLMLALAASCAITVFAQQADVAGGPAVITANASSSSSSMNTVATGGNGARAQVAPQVSEQPWLFRHYGIGTYSSPLGFGGRVAVSLTRSLNLRAGGSYFSFGINRSVGSVPFSANVVLQSEQANVDWYPFHRSSFHLSPGVLFGSSNRAYGSASIAAGNSFTLNNVNYYSGSAGPVQASGAVRFERTAPTFTVGWGDWVRGEHKRHWAFPFEVGFAYTGNPQTVLNFSGVVCTDAGQHYCQNIADDPSVQSNIAVERKRLQNDANWLSFYPIIAGGIVYRF